MTSFCWTQEQAKEKGWGLAPILPPNKRRGENFLHSARAQRLLRGAQYQCTWATWWLPSLLWPQSKVCSGCCDVMRRLTCMTMLALFPTLHLRLLPRDCCRQQGTCTLLKLLAASDRQCAPSALGAVSLWLIAYAEVCARLSLCKESHVHANADDRYRTTVPQDASQCYTPSIWRWLLPYTRRMIQRCP